MMRRIVVGITAAELVVCDASILEGTFDQWWHDEDMGHGFVVPIVILWIVWKERNRWIALPTQPSWWGFARLTVAACLHFMSAMGAGLFAGSVAFVLSLAGALLCLGSFAFLRTWTFPFLLALFMLPKLAIAHNQVTCPYNFSPVGSLKSC